MTAYAPTFLAVEVENHFPLLQEEQGIDPARARQEWNRFVPRIKFIDVGGPDSSYAGVTDPKDVPYVLLQKRLPVPIVSEDPHLAKMGATVIRIQIFSPLRSCSRQRAVEYQIKVAGIGAAFAVGLAAKLAIDGARAATRAIANLPKPVLAIGAVGIIAALVHPPARKWIFEQLEKAAGFAGAAAGGIYECLQPVLEEHSSAKQSADQFLVAVTALLTDAGIAPADVLRKPSEPVKLKRTRKRSTGAKRIRTISENLGSPAPAGLDRGAEQRAHLERELRRPDSAPVPQEPAPDSVSVKYRPGFGCPENRSRHSSRPTRSRKS